MTISITDYQRKRPVEVDLWGHLFELVAITKRTDSKINDDLAAINKHYADEDLTKHAVQTMAFAARMDVRLKKSPGGKKSASTLIKAKWASDDLTVPQLDQFWEAVDEAVASGVSPREPIAIEAFAGATVDVDLWGTPFVAIPITCSSEPSIDEKLAAIEKDFVGKELTHEMQAEIFGRRFEARLKPAEEGGASALEIVREKWEADDLEVPQLAAFWEAVLEELVRPS